MNNFSVLVIPYGEKKFLASYLHPLTGRRVRNFFNSKEEALDYKKKTEADFKKEPKRLQALTIEELLILYIRHNKKSDFNKAKMHLIDFAETYGKLKIEELSSEEIRLWLEGIQAENGIKEISVRSIKCTIDAFFKYLVQREIISESPMTEIFYKNVPKDISARNILSKVQIDELLAAAKVYSPGYLYPIVRLFADTAIRPAEAINLAWSQVDLEKKQIHFPRTEFSQDRTLEISDELAEILGKSKKDSGPVFRTYYKETFTKYKLSRLINEFKLNGKCEIKWSPMDLRHSFAMNFLSEGGDITRLQYILGHWNVYDTKRLYSKVLKHAHEEAVSPYEIGS